jgi:predicted ATPase
MERMVILHGANGAGKTRHLETIHNAEPDSVYLPDYRLGATPLGMGRGEYALAMLRDAIDNAPNGALIVIDEPEQSLHIAIQQRLVKDWIALCESRGLRFVIATHSPDIINDRWDLTCEVKRP